MPIYLKKIFKNVIPFLFITGSVPHYILIWLSWRTLTIVCPSALYQAGDDLLYSWYQRLMLFFFEHTSGAKIYLHGDAASLVTKKEKVIYISNHQCTMDWMVADMLAIRQKSDGHVRFVMKSTLQILPIYGFYFHQHGCVYVKRGNFNANKMRYGLQYLQNKNINPWLVIFPEGTRFNSNNKELLQKHHDMAKEQGFQPLTHLLTPKPRGMQLAIKELIQNLDAVYDTTIIYSSTYDPEKKVRTASPTIFDFLCIKDPEIHIHTKRIDIKEIPYEDDEDFKAWLMNCFIEKDELLTTTFNKEKSTLRNKGTLSRLPLMETLPSVILFSLLTIPFVATKFGRNLYWKTWIFGSIACYSWLGLRSVA